MAMCISDNATRARLRRGGILQWMTRVVAGVYLIHLPACQLPNARIAEPGPALPGKFPLEFPRAADTPSSAQVSVAEFFHDPVLTDLVQEAVQNNQELKILAEAVEIASSDVLARKGAYLPFVELRGGASLRKTPKFTPDGAVEEGLELVPGRQRTRARFTPEGMVELEREEAEGTPFPDPLPNFLVAAEFSWEVDIWRRLRGLEDAAARRYLATNEGRKYVMTRLVAEIAETYYELRALDAQVLVIDQTIALQQESLQIAEAKKAAGRETELAIQRFQAEVRKNQSERVLVQQEIVKAENRINMLLGRFPERVQRSGVDFLELNLDALSVGVSPELLQNRPDIRRAELEVKSTGFDVDAARAAFLPQLTLTGGVGYEATRARFLLETPDSLAWNIAGGLVGPLLNRTEIEAEFRAANARQLAAMYEYQRTVMNAFTEVVNRITMVQNFRESIKLQKEQLQSLEASVASAAQLFQNARAEYSEVLFAQRDLLEARLALIETKRKQLAAIVNAYQALGGGAVIRRDSPAEGSAHDPRADSTDRKLGSLELKPA